MALVHPSQKQGESCVGQVKRGHNLEVHRGVTSGLASEAYEVSRSAFCFLRRRDACACYRGVTSGLTSDAYEVSRSALFLRQAYLKVGVPRRPAELKFGVPRAFPNDIPN